MHVISDPEQEFLQWPREMALCFLTGLHTGRAQASHMHRRHKKLTTVQVVSFLPACGILSLD